MPTETVPTFQQGQIMFAKVADFNPDGTTLDLTEPLTLTTSASTIVGVAIDPTDNRKVKLTGASPGNATVTVSAAGVPSGNGLTLLCTVSAPPPNLSRIELVEITGPF